MWVGKGSFLCQRLNDKHNPPLRAHRPNSAVHLAFVAPDED